MTVKEVSEDAEGAERAAPFQITVGFGPKKLVPVTVIVPPAVGTEVGLIDDTAGAT